MSNNEKKSKKVINTKKQVQILVDYINQRRKKLAGKIDPSTGVSYR